MNAPFSIWSQYYNTKEPEEAILAFERDGLTHIELSHEHSAALLARCEDHIAEGKRFAAFLKEHGISAPQGHLDFPTKLVREENYVDSLVREIEMFEAIGIKNAVLHIDPINAEETDYRERLELNIPKLCELVAKIEHVDITLCLENLCITFISIEDILEVIERVGSDKLGICLDTGHLNILKANTQGDFIRKAGKYLKALHVHDNDGSSDQHLIPFARGNIDFKDIVYALRDIDYDGLFNFEIPGDSHHCPVEVKHAKVQYVRAIYDYLMSL